MNIVRWVVAFIVVLCMASIVDLIVNYILENTTNWGILGESCLKISVSIGKFSIGYFYLYPQIKVIYNRLGE